MYEVEYIRDDQHYSISFIDSSITIDQSITDLSEIDTRAIDVEIERVIDIR